MSVVRLEISPSVLEPYIYKSEQQLNDWACALCQSAAESGQWRGIVMHLLCMEQVVRQLEVARLLKEEHEAEVKAAYG